MIKLLSVFGVLCMLAACGVSTHSTQYTKSGNCNGPSVRTIRFAPEPSARMFPEAVWFEECPGDKFYMKIGDGEWKAITKKQADDGASTLKAAGRSVVRVVD